ncbi:SCO2400 family protein [Streptomyces showdoensis]|uniref:Uncharacterized protein n=1 Tax=Streptomyces showdoensis TaxID=68268 RepID=A0A2P2GE99_STREW|nr:hypothetical protein [Streptomyces showdoensis]KKZ69850.1 hypothetical protein VO63_32015 [Streptomyces showdoensis]
MDYCHQCRRHLNGALACAGCGTPAEELRYRAPHPIAEPAYVPPPAAEPEFGDAFELDLLEPPRPARGRAAARRGARGAGKGGRRARSRRGRTVLLGTLGLVLAAGALSMARLALEPDGGGAATAVREEEVVETPLDPAVPTPSESTGRSEDPGTVEQPDSAGPTPTGHASQGPGDDGAAGGGSGGSGDSGAPAGGTGTGSGSGTGSGDGSGGPSPRTSTGSPAPGGTPSATASGSASPTASGPAPTTGTGTPSATPSSSPSPTPTCTRFLWWCV